MILNTWKAFVVAEEKDRDGVDQRVEQTTDIMTEYHSGRHDNASPAPAHQSLSKEAHNAPAALEGHSDACPSERAHLEESGASAKLDMVQLSGTMSSEASEQVEQASTQVLATGWGAPLAIEREGVHAWQSAGQADKAYRLIKQLQVRLQRSKPVFPEASKDRRKRDASALCFGSTCPVAIGHLICG
jgi:hypothetical protein